jgi:poly(3-hydroxybutyrate) depolymerase
MRLCLILVTLLLVPLNNSADKDEITKELITVKGMTRAYYLYVPSTIKAPATAPLILALHGSGRRGISLVEKWKDIAKKEGIIVVGPDSTDPRSWGTTHDGPDYLHILVEELKAKYPVDARRVYLFGHSAGASFALQLSLLESEYFAATAVHAGALDASDGDLFELAKRKIPISIQVGDRDQAFPLAGVRATRDALKANGFLVELIELAGHDHWYYDLAPKINRTAWDFLKTRSLEKDPQYRKYNFNN